MPPVNSINISIHAAFFGKYFNTATPKPIFLPPPTCCPWDMQATHNPHHSSAKLGGTLYPYHPVVPSLHRSASNASLLKRSVSERIPLLLEAFIVINASRWLTQPPDALQPMGSSALPPLQFQGSKCCCQSISTQNSRAGIVKHAGNGMELTGWTFCRTCSRMPCRAPVFRDS